MTRLALAGKCGGLGDRGFSIFDFRFSIESEAKAREDMPLARMDASAIFPTPTPHCWKKCRRVISRSSQRFRGWGQLQGISGLLGIIRRFRRFAQIEMQVFESAP